MERVRWGLLSTANINRKLIPAIRLSKRGELIAVASRSADKANTYAREMEIPKSFGSYQAMLDSGEIDVVYISLPNHLHAEWTIKALRAGVNVLCEKPFATTLQETDDMIAASHDSGKSLSEAFMYRHHPQTKIVGDFVRKGNLGVISHVTGTFTFKIGKRDDVRLVPEYGGGSLWDVGVYPLSLAQYIYGEPPATVFGMQWLGDTGVDETFVGQMRYSGDRFAQISCGFRSEVNTSFEIAGTEGRLTLNRPFTSMEENRQAIYYPNSGHPMELPVPEKELYLGEVEDMNDAILDGAPNYLTLEETRNHMRTALALLESARTGRPVELAEFL
jgi:xylose dehydrogenase (NAD/NADP)